MHSTNCLNCGTGLEFNQQFCSHCGQRADTHRLTIRHFFHEFFHAFTHADKGIFHLLADLATKPGVVARNYLTGKRKSYFNPFTFFLIMMGIFVISNKMFRTERTDAVVPKEILAIPNIQQREGAIAMFERGNRVSNFMKNNGNVVSMIAIPLMAFVFWIFFRRKNFNYAEHLTANLMFTAFANIVFTLLIFPLQKLMQGSGYVPLLTLFGLIFQVAYFSWAYNGLFQVRSAAGKFEIIGVSILSILVWSLFSMTLMAIYIYQSWNFYQFFGRMIR
ncbi:MAG: DUF3667 domain-containing protein [Chitinophagaceae bacterium]|nr:DUF3667 domain-containing protein [Chitinophagaceae bacterium]